MDIIVKKFGGTSLADIDTIKKVASAIGLSLKDNKSGNNNDKKAKQVIVVSAMAGKTNELVGLVNSISLFPEASEYDLVVASGEQVSCGLLSIALNDLGIKAKSLMPWQVGINTDENHINAKYMNIDAKAISEELRGVDIVIIPGFQGISSKGKRLTTIGRGGSDVTAVAIAKAMSAKICEIYTDVSGVYSSNPRIVKNAKLISNLGYEEMLELSSLGAKVLHPRAVSLGMEYNVPIRILNTFDFIKEPNPIEYTNIYDMDMANSEEYGKENIMETKKIKAVIHSNDFSLLQIKSNDLDIVSIIDTLESSGILINSVNQNLVSGGDNHDTEVTIITPRSDGKRAFNILQANGGIDIKLFDTQSMISVVGSNINNDSKVLKTITNVNKKYAIKPINMLSTTTRISMFVDEEFGELITRILHDELISEPDKLDNNSANQQTA